MNFSSTEAAFQATHAAIGKQRAILSSLFAAAENATDSEREQLGRSIKTANTELSGLVDRVQSLKAELFEERQPVGRQVNPAEDQDWAPGRSSSPRPDGPNWGDVVVKAAEEQAGIRGGLKSFLPSGTAVVEVPVGGPFADPRRARFLADLLPFENAPGGHMSYLRQTVRTNNAAVVAEGALKPTSTYELTRVDDSTDVVAHLSDALPRFYFEDSDKIRQFIEAEMRLGVDLAIDAKIVADILAAGILFEGSLGGDVLFATRRAITRLEEREVTPSAFAMHPRDWEEAERAAQETFAANPGQNTPTDTMARRLWGVPVTVTNSLTEGTILLGDFRNSAALYRTGGVRVDWSEATYDSGAGSTDWERNLIRFRAETRVQTAIYRSFAFVAIEAEATGS